jgi:hypothetical protein
MRVFFSVPMPVDSWPSAQAANGDIPRHNPWVIMVSGGIQWEQRSGARRIFRERLRGQRRCDMLERSALCFDS